MNLGRIYVIDAEIVSFPVFVHLLGNIYMHFGAIDSGSLNVQVFDGYFSGSLA